MTLFIDKSLKRANLVQKEVQVQRSGKTFMRRQWVRVGEVPDTTPPTFSPVEFEKLKGNRTVAMKYPRAHGVTRDRHDQPADDWLRALRGVS